MVYASDLISTSLIIQYRVNILAIGIKIMAFIRIKKIKGYDYYYLVRSQWDPVKKRSTQHIIKYLGNAENINIKDIPEEHRDNPKVLSFLALSSTIQKEKKVNT